MEKLIFIVCLFFVSQTVISQNANAPFSDTTFNLGFERIRGGVALHFYKPKTEGYEISADSKVKHNGKYIACGFSFLARHLPSQPTCYIYLAYMRGIGSTGHYLWLRKG